MNKAITFVVLATVLLAVNSQTPPTWGGNPVYTVKVGMVYDNPKANWTFTYYYDWNLKVERYEHQSGEYDQMCALAQTTFDKGGIPCDITFAKDGWSYISFPTKNWCCKCGNTFGSVRYDWLKEDSTYIGVETIDGKSVTHWTKSGASLNHYYSTVDKQLPVRYFELKNGLPKYWLFDLTTYNTGPIDPTKFASQCQTQCTGTCQRFRKEESNLKTSEGMK